MTGPVAALGLGAIELTGPQHFLLLLPLCLSIAVVYKTTRCAQLRDVPLAALALWGTIVVGMWAVGLTLWAIYSMMV